MFESLPFSHSPPIFCYLYYSIPGGPHVAGAVLRYRRDGPRARALTNEKSLPDRWMSHVIPNFPLWSLPLHHASAWCHACKHELNSTEQDGEYTHNNPAWSKRGISSPEHELLPLEQKDSVGRQSPYTSYVCRPDARGRQGPTQ